MGAALTPPVAADRLDAQHFCPLGIQDELNSSSRGKIFAFGIQEDRYIHWLRKLTQGHVSGYAVSDCKVPAIFFPALLPRMAPIN